MSDNTYTPDFITLSSSQSQETIQHSSESASPRVFRPNFPPATHDTYHSNFHLKLDKFAEALDRSAQRAFPNTSRFHSAQPRYTTVQVLLLRWEQDDLDVETELADLKNVFEDYGFRTTKWTIPSEDAHSKLMRRVLEFTDAYGRKDCLMIVYYGGHAFINEARQITWACSRRRPNVRLDWSSVQSVFESKNSDVLLLLDCCAAASSAPKGGNGMIETIAACGWGDIAEEPGRYSFTNALIEVLQDWINYRFSVAMLHSRVLDVLKHPRPEFRGIRRVECRKTPVYIVTTQDPGSPSIVLNRTQAALRTVEPTPSKKRRRDEDVETSKARRRTLRKPKKSKVRKQPALDDDEEDNEQPTSTIATNSESLRQSIEVTQLPSPPPTDYSEHGHSLFAQSPDGTLRLPHVLISVTLVEDQTLDAEVCSKWLASFPALVKYVKVESVYRSYSTVLIISIPVFIWDGLPDDPACRFIAYVRTDNVLTKKNESTVKRISWSTGPSHQSSKSLQELSTSFNKNGDSHPTARTPKALTMETTEPKDDNFWIQDLGQTSRVGTRLPSRPRSMSVRRSMSPVSGNALRLPGDPAPSTHSTRSTAVKKGRCSPSSSTKSLPRNQPETRSIASVNTLPGKKPRNRGLRRGEIESEL